jgi:putative Holliday junction resolvase
VLPKPGKILSLDLGTRRTGVAVSDPAQKVAFARPEIEHHSDKELLIALQKLVTAENVVGLLLGHPTKLSGEGTEQTITVEATAKVLEALQLPIQFMDERLSSQFAQDLHGFQTEEKFHDSRAAQIFLETYLQML